MFHPPKPIIFAPSFMCSSKRGVCLRTGLAELLTIFPPYVGSSERQHFTADSIGVTSPQKSPRYKKRRAHCGLESSKISELKDSRTQEEPTVSCRGPHRSILEFLSSWQGGTDFTWPFDRGVRLLDRPTKNAVREQACRRGGRTRLFPMSLVQTSSYARAA